MAVKLITAPATYPVSLVEAKAHLRVDFDDDDTLIDVYRKAATEDTERFTGRAFIEQTWDFYLDAFPTDGSSIRIPKPPLISVDGVFYQDGNGDEQEAAASIYRVDNASELARVSLAYAASWPSARSVTNAVRIRFTAGYVDGNSPAAANVPYAVKAAIMLILGTLYAHRETVVIGQSVAMMPWAAEQLLWPYRVHTAMA
jgi:uncharacterized phiE125 gp8 family phage protein